MSLDTNSKATGRAGWWETGKIVVQALAIAMVVRVFFYQPFNIPSGSMKQTLLVGDYLFVSKLSYGYSRFSFPFGLDLFSGRIFAAEPKRGDVVVFKLPRDNSTDYIKRVVGLPGDEIRVQDGVLFINGTAVPKVRKGEFLNSRGGRRSPPRSDVRGDPAERRQIHRPRQRPSRSIRQCRSLQGAARPLFHDGRQP